MPRSATTGVFARVSNSFSNPVFGTLIDPTDADAYFDDLDGGLNPPELDGPVRFINSLQVGTTGTAAGTIDFLNATSGSITLSPPVGALGTVTLTVPAATDTLVGRATTDNLTNKTYNKVTITAPATSATLTLIDGTTLTGPAASGTVMTLGNTETVTGIKTFGSAGAVGRFKLAGTTSGTITLDATAVAGANTLTLPAATDTLVGKATTDTFTNKTYDTAGTGNSFSINSVAVTANTGTGAVARATSPTFVTPTLGAASATQLTFSSTSGIIGTTTNDSAAAGSVGEFVSSTVVQGSAVSVTSGAATNITSISLTAGDWDVRGNVIHIPAATTNVTQLATNINTVSATLNAAADRLAVTTYPGSVLGANNASAPPVICRLSLSGTTTVYLIAFPSFTVSTMTAWGQIQARRVR